MHPQPPVLQIPPPDVTQPPPPQSEIVSPPALQPTPSIVPEKPTVLPATQPKKSRFGTIFSALVILFLLLGLGGLGYWAYQLNSNLKATQQDLARLQVNYDKLATEKNSLAVLLARTQSELVKIRSDLVTTRSDLTKSRDDAAALQDRMDKAGKLTEVLIVHKVDNATDDVIERKILASGDAKLLRLFYTFKVDYKKGNASLNMSNYLNWRNYLVEAIRDSLE